MYIHVHKLKEQDDESAAISLHVQGKKRNPSQREKVREREKTPRIVPTL